MQLEQLLANLWQQYTMDSPQVLAIYNLLQAHGENNIINDHIALRTFADERINIDVLEKFFIDLGYTSCGEYHFPVKQLYARHYEHADDKPKIFISQLQTQQFSPWLQQTVRSCIDEISLDQLSNINLLYAGVLWQELDYTIYQRLLSESDYAAWLYVFGFRANHFTVLVNKLQKFTSVEQLNTFLKQNEIVLNTSGGEIKGTSAQLLEQSSTMANQVVVKFKQGSFPVSNSYYEFAKRYPQANGSLYQGFIAASADKIFESTNN